MPASDAWLEPYPLSSGETAMLGKVRVAGATRQFLVDLPEPYDPALAYPIFFSFHGAGGGMEIASAQEFGKLWNGQAIVVYPQARPEWQTEPTSDDYPFFSAMLAEIGDETCVDLQRVFVEGTSRGAVMALGLACLRRDVIDGFAAVASTLPLPIDWCDGPVPAWIMHGRDDMTIPLDSGEQVRDAWRAENGCAAASEPIPGSPCVSYTPCRRAPVVWCVHDGGHDLPNVQGLDDDLVRFLRTL